MKKITILLLICLCSLALVENATIDTEKIDGLMSDKLLGATKYNRSDWMKGNLNIEPYQDQRYDTSAANLLEETGIKIIRYPVFDFSSVFAYPDIAMNRHARDAFGLPDTFDFYADWQEQTLNPIEFFKLCEDKNISLLLSVEGSFFGGGWYPNENNLYIDSTDYMFADSFMHSGEQYYYYQYEIERFAKPFMQIFHFLYGDPASSDSLESAWAKLRAYSTDVSELGTYVGYNHPEPFDNDIYFSQERT